MIISRPSPTDVALHCSTATVYLVTNGLLVNEYRIDRPGEYDVAGIAFEVGEGYALMHSDGLRIVAIEPGPAKLAVEAIKALEDIELVIVPAEPDASRRKAIANLLNECEPRGVVVLGTADDTKALAGQSVEPSPKVKIVAADLTGEELRVWAVA